MSNDAVEKAAEAWRAFAARQRQHAVACEERADAIRARLARRADLVTADAAG